MSVNSLEDRANSLAVKCGHKNFDSSLLADYKIIDKSSVEWSLEEKARYFAQCHNCPSFDQAEFEILHELKGQTVISKILSALEMILIILSLPAYLGSYFSNKYKMAAEDRLFRAAMDASGISDSDQKLMKDWIRKFRDIDGQSYLRREEPGFKESLITFLLFWGAIFILIIWLNN